MIETVKQTMEEVIKKLRKMDINPNDIKGRKYIFIPLYFQIFIV